MKIQERAKKIRSPHYASMFIAIALVCIAVVTLALLAAVQLVALSAGQDTSSERQRLGLIGSASDNVAGAELQKETYQAVFLANDQVYFGRIREITAETIVMDTVFYPEEKEAAADGETVADGSNITLKKLGTGEFHQPDDELVLTRSQVMYWQNLREDSRVSKGMKEYLEKNEAAKQNAAESTEEQTGNEEEAEKTE